MPFIPNTDQDRQEMLSKIGVSSFEDLISIIPEEIRLKDPIGLPPKLSEYEAMKLLNKYADENVTAATHTCFMGFGAYDRYIPAIVGSVLERPEFKTAYTPYQAEVSQGTLQAMYEFQSMICELTQMDVANASLYDGGTALAEACLMSHAHNKKREIIFCGTVHPNYLRVVKTLCVGKKLTYKIILDDDGMCDLSKLTSEISDDTCAVIVQHPNAYGSLEDVFEIEKIVHSKKALFIVSVDPISLGLIEPPGNYNADIVVGEGQQLGVPMNFGGPYLGLFACKKEFVRKIPGRLAGITEDIDGKRGFVLTLQTREQQIKRERATSNICTNQGLIMLAATVYMETMGKEGIKEVAEMSFTGAHYLADEIKKIPGYDLVIDKPFFNEFLIKTPVQANEIFDAGIEEGILAGIDLSRFDGLKGGLLIAVTEKRSREELDAFVMFLKRFS